ncbi:MMPL family transporter [Streptomyces radicis]|uniref:MMPL family transporter n=1 Tax=Streptomyces radicis TaxID=1750517 RepID=A0A3A9W5C1_9ACTN|nr:MMPL family transporter [Streptomyces radicis]RKN07902.1 MMPL family transporter [Streptomyces radicis]RKN20644.1 MMPL family transporter [Streptomyces radicis]
MLAKLSGFLPRRRRAVLLVAVLLALASAALSATLFDRMKAGGFDDPTAESGRAADALAEDFGQEDMNLALLIRAESGVDSPEARAAGTALAERLANDDGIAAVTSYWATGAPGLRGEDGDAALVLAAIEGDDTEAEDRLTALEPRYEGEADGGLHVEVGGSVAINKELGEISERDAVRGELIALPIMLAVLVLVFGSLVAAAIPLITGVITILLSMGMLWVLAGLTDVSVLAVNVVTLLGLGLAVDYSLLMVNRYREEIAAGHERSKALRIMMTSSGRTVIFSAVTVAVTLAGLAWFPLLALRSIAYGGIAVAALTAVVTLTVLPALLALLGPRVEGGRTRRRSAPGVNAPLENGFWHRLASFVMRRPLPVATLGVLFLLLLGSPFLGLRMGTADERALPESSQSRQVAETLRAEFDAGESQTIDVVVPEGITEAELTFYAADLSALDDVARVDTASGTYVDGAQVADPGPAHARHAADDGGVHLAVVPEPVGNAAVEDLLAEVRAAPAPDDALVGGRIAIGVDGIEAITDRIPVAGITLAAAMLVLLFLLTGSVLLPFVAMLLSALGLTATFGALVWGFQDGNLAGLLGFTETGAVVGTVPVLLFAIAFGLGMDYQVFMLSRIREEYERTGSPTEAVALGLERMGRIVTAAAVVLSVVFLGFAISDISFMQALGVGAPLAVLMDATLIRGALLPAAMRLGGRAMWWLPPVLRGVHRRFGLNESAADEPRTRNTGEREQAQPSTTGIR